MSFRTVIVKNRSKLDYTMNYMVYRGEVTKKIHLSEISILIIESTAVSLTTALLSELIKHKIKVIFCDEKHMPHSQLIGFYDNYHSVKNIQTQITWYQDTKDLVWQNIVVAKINNQARLMEKNSIDCTLLNNYISEVLPGDKTNREGHASKVYFNNLFDMLNRRVPSFFNSALNYGYAIVLSAFCREIVSRGYVTQIGIWHCNEFNHYNLASDLMETFRVIVDDMVLQLSENDNNYKSKIANIMNAKVLINDKSMYFTNAIEVYVKSVLNALCNNDINLITNFHSYELPIYENDLDNCE